MSETYFPYDFAHLHGDLIRTNRFYYPTPANNEVNLNPGKGDIIP
jgi:hypothetical protein